MHDVRHAIDEGQPQKALRLLKRSIRDKRFSKNHLPFDLHLILHYAITHSTPGIFPLLRFLLQRGADANLELQGRTSLWHAIQRGDEKIVQLLLAHRALLNCKDSDHQTPMHHAVHAGNAAVVEGLLRAGAAIHYKDRAGLTPSECAALNHRDDLVALIEQLAPHVGPPYLQYARRERIVLVVLEYNRANYLALDFNDIERPVILGSGEGGWSRHTIAEVLSTYRRYLTYPWLVPMLERMRTDGELNVPKLLRLGEAGRRSEFRIVRAGSIWPEGW